MKSSLIALMLLMNVSLAHAGAGSSGGGDPLEILATSYPDTQMLSAALQLAEDRVSASSIPSDLKSKYLSESEALIAQNNFKLLPAIILIGQQQEVGGYSLPHDADKFIALGAMTKFEAGAPVYLAERVQKYSVEKLAEVLLHEILHHILAIGLTDDEKFIEALTDSIIKGQTDPKLLKALELGGYFRKDFIHSVAFYKASEMELLIEKHALKLEMFSSPAVIENFRKVLAAVPKNLANYSVYQVQKMYEKVLNSGTHNINTAQTFGAHYPGVFYRFAKKVNPETYEQVNSNTFGCRRPVGFFGSCKHQDQLKMNELFSL